MVVVVHNNNNASDSGGPRNCIETWRSIMYDYRATDIIKSLEFFRVQALWRNKRSLCSRVCAEKKVLYGTPQLWLCFALLWKWLYLETINLGMSGASSIHNFVFRQKAHEQYIAMASGYFWQAFERTNVKVYISAVRNSITSSDKWHCSL